MGVHLSGWASNLRQLRASTHKDWASNFGGILVAHSQGLGFQLGWVWLSIVGRCGLPTWTNVVAQHGRSWASSLGGLGCPLWTGMGSQHGQTWSPTHKDWASSLGGFGCPLWVDVVAQRGRRWASNMDKVGCPVWVSVGSQYGRSWTSNVDKDGCPRWTDVGFQDGQKWMPNVDRMWLPKSAHYRTPISAHYRIPTIACPSWVPIVGLPFCGGIWSPIIGHPSAPNYWASTPLRCGQDSWAPFLDACGPTRTGRPRHLSTRRPIGHVGANRFNAQVRSPISIKCRFTSVGSNFFLIKNIFRNTCKSANCAFPLHRSLSVRRQMNK